MSRELMTITEFDYIWVTLVCSGEEIRCIMEEGIDEEESGRMKLITEKEGELPFREGDTIRLKLNTKDGSYEGGEVAIDKLEMGKGGDRTRFTIQFHRVW